MIKISRRSPCRFGVVPHDILRAVFRVDRNLPIRTGRFRPAQLRELGLEFRLAEIDLVVRHPRAGIGNIDPLDIVGQPRNGDFLPFRNVTGGDRSVANPSHRVLHKLQNTVDY